MSPEKPGNNPCIVPTQKRDLNGDKRWESMHLRHLKELESSEAEVLFLGDSIVQQLQFSSLWANQLSSLHCLNFGIGGDRVEHVLWRVTHGELDFASGSKPGAVVLFVGTNNSGCTAQQIFEGIFEIVRVIRKKLPDAHVILPTLLPRGQFHNVNRDRNDEVNVLLRREFSDGADSKIHVVVVHEDILQEDGTLPHHLMHDYLHLTNSGYTKVFAPIYDKLVCLLYKNDKS